MENKIKVVAATQNQAALGIINAYLLLNPKSTLSQLRQKFPNDIAPDKGVTELFLPETDALELNQNKNIVLYFGKPSQIIKLENDENVALSYIWTKDSLQNLLDNVYEDGIEMELISFKDANEKNIEGYELQYMNGFKPSDKKSPIYNPKQSLGSSTEFLITSLLLDEGREVWLPTVDDHGVDLLVKTREVCQGDRSKAEHYDFQEIQIKSASGTKEALFVIDLKQAKPNYWFIFYVKKINTFWLINSMDIATPGAFSQNKSGDNVGKYNISLTTQSLNISKKNEEYIVKNFALIP